MSIDNVAKFVPLLFSDYVKRCEACCEYAYARLQTSFFVHVYLELFSCKWLSFLFWKVDFNN